MLRVRGRRLRVGKQFQHFRSPGLGEDKEHATKCLAGERLHDCADRFLGNRMAKRDAVFVGGPEMNAGPNARAHHIFLCFGQAVPTPRSMPLLASPRPKTS